MGGVLVLVIVLGVIGLQLGDDKESFVADVTGLCRDTTSEVGESLGAGTEVPENWDAAADSIEDFGNDVRDLDIPDEDREIFDNYLFQVDALPTAMRELANTMRSEGIVPEETLFGEPGFEEIREVASTVIDGSGNAEDYGLGAECGRTNGDSGEMLGVTGSL